MSSNQGSALGSGGMEPDRAEPDFGLRAGLRDGFQKSRARMPTPGSNPSELNAKNCIMAKLCPDFFFEIDFLRVKLSSLYINLGQNST